MLNTETILLIVSLFSNAVIILKKIKVIWTPCLIIQCSSESVDDANNNVVESNSDRSVKFQKFIQRITPRTKNIVPDQKRDAVDLV